MRGRLEVSSGFVLLLALMLFWDRQGLVPRFLLAAAVHEGGHMAAAYLVGAPPDKLSLSAFGAKLELAGTQGLSYGREALVALAGPAVNLALALLCARWGGEEAQLWSGIHLCLGLFQLIPALPLDGGRVLYAMAARLGSLAGAVRLLQVSGLVSTGAILLLGAWVLYLGGRNGTLFLLGLWLLWGNFREMGLVKARGTG